MPSMEEMQKMMQFEQLHEFKSRGPIPPSEILDRERISQQRTTENFRAILDLTQVRTCLGMRVMFRFLDGTVWAENANKVQQVVSSVRDLLALGENPDFGRVLDNDLERVVSLMKLAKRECLDSEKDTARSITIPPEAELSLQSRRME